MAKDKLGGGVANAVQLRGVDVVDTGGVNRDITALVSGINESIATVAKVAQVEKIQRNEEDKVRATARAEEEHIDSNNAMLGGSYDSELNKQVDTWRSSGLLDSEIRLKIKDYKFNKAVDSSGLGVDGGRNADDTDLAFFDTYNKLELKALTPMLQEDRKSIQTKIGNTVASYIRTSSDDVQTKLNNTLTTYKSYGLGEEEANATLIQTAFDSARKGDETLLHSLDNVTNSQGEKLLDTMTGSAMYSKLSDNLLAKKEHDQAKARQETEYQQEVIATRLYTDMIDTKDYSAFKLNIDNALESGGISMKQHASLNSVFDTATKFDRFPKQSDPNTYIQAYAKASKGLMSSDDLVAISSRLSSSDFESITRKAIDSGGINGIGSEEGKALESRIKNDATAYTNMSSINDQLVSFQDKEIFSKRYALVNQQLNNKVDTFITLNKRYPTEDEYTKIRDEVVSLGKQTYPDSLGKQPELKDRTTKEDKPSDKVNGKQDLKDKIKSLPTPEARADYIRSLSPAEKELLRK